MYLIKTILDSRTKQRRTDGRYPNRIGSKVNIVNLTIKGAMEPGNMLVLDYIEDNQGNPKDGTLRSSRILDIISYGRIIEIVTHNSIYVLEEIV